MKQKMVVGSYCLESIIDSDCISLVLYKISNKNQDLSQIGDGIFLSSAIEPIEYWLERHEVEDLFYPQLRQLLA